MHRNLCLLRNTLNLFAFEKEALLDGFLCCKFFYSLLHCSSYKNVLSAAWLSFPVGTKVKGGLDHLPPKFEHIFVAVITSPPFFLCRYFYYQLVAYCVCFKMICEMAL